MESHESIVTVNNVTFAENHAGHAWGAMGDDEDVTVTNTIFLNNTAANPWGITQTCQNTMQGSNNIQWPQVESDSTDCTPGIVYADPLLGPLGDNGGPTQTMIPGGESPAVDNGDGCVSNDQRGLPRDSECDIGAVELQPGEGV